jgi:glycine cleavage system aminomethyltransferase T
LVKGGRARQGEVIEIYNMGQRTKAEIVDTVFVDKVGEKLHA